MTKAKRYCFYINLLAEDMTVVDSTYDHRYIKGSNDDEVYHRAIEYFDACLPLGSARYFEIEKWLEAAE